MTLKYKDELTTDTETQGLYTQWLDWQQVMLIREQCCSQDHLNRDQVMTKTRVYRGRVKTKTKAGRDRVKTRPLKIHKQ